MAVRERELNPFLQLLTAGTRVGHDWLAVIMTNLIYHTGSSVPCHCGFSGRGRAAH